GRLGVPQPTDERLPALWGSVLTWLPAASRAAPRRGTIVAGALPVPKDPLAVENAVHYLARALVARDGDFARRTWTLIEEASQASSRDLWRFFEELLRVADAWDDARGLARYLRTYVLTADEIAGAGAAAPAPLLAEARAAGLLWNRVVHYRGRGFLRGDRLDERLGALLAKRVLIDHLVHLDEAGARDLPGRYVRRLRYEALIPVEQAKVLARELRKTMPSLKR